MTLKMLRTFPLLYIYALFWLQNKSGAYGQISDNSRLNYFDTDLMRYFGEENRGNVMISPASVKSTLAMILEGADGPTASEIRSALRLSPHKEDYREQLNLYLTTLKAKSTGTFLKNANGVFVSENLRLKKEYEMMLQKVYFAEVSRMDFRDPIPTTEKINSWVNISTNGLIPDIVMPVNINPATKILLVNALYFKSFWRHSFNKSATRGGCFYNSGACRTVAMMELQAELNYAYVENLRAHAVELPYENGRFSMLIVVPQEREGLTPLIRDLPYMSVPQILEEMEPSDVMLVMPKFTVEYSADLVEPLKNMRITSMFTSKANLSGMFDGDSPYINNFYHKVHLTVDETGTVAAAATGALVIPLIEDGVQLRVDRPFIFFIRDNLLGSVLFEGKIEEPTIYVDKNGMNGPAAKKNSRIITNKSFY